MVTRAIHTDLYQLTMLASYFHRRMHDVPAVCELFVRRLPQNRRFLVACGLAQAIEYLEELRFTDAQIESLREIPALRRALSADFIEYLRAFRFRGDAFAMPEGTIAFQNEPLVRIHAPLGEAQLIETALLSIINHQTLIASKAARIVLAAQGRSVMEFGTRRTHPEAAVDVARAAYIAGFDGSSNVEAAYRYEVPARGTMAHMYVMASQNETEAFASYAPLFPHSTYLVDTYETLRGVSHALDAAPDLSAVRLDSGDLATLSRQVRTLLRERGRPDVGIVLSSDLDEYEVERLTHEGDFDAAGVGTRLAVSEDAPSLGGVYKLVQIGDRPVAKLSASKVTYPGAHQVYRHLNDGEMVSDQLGMVDEKSYEFIGTTPLLVPVMEAGRVIFRESIHDARQRARRGLEQLPETLRRIGPREDRFQQHFEVRPSAQLVALLETCRAQVEDVENPA